MCCAQGEHRRGSASFAVGRETAAPDPCRSRMHDRSEPLLSPGTPSRHSTTRTLGVLSVVSLVFFNVSGGPLGSEGIVSAAGPLVGLSAILAFVLLFSIPQAMVTAELSTALPDNGGYSLWVKAAFGPFWAVQVCGSPAGHCG